MPLTFNQAVTNALRTRQQVLSGQLSESLADQFNPGWRNPGGADVVRDASQGVLPSYVGKLGFDYTEEQARNTLAAPYQLPPGGNLQGRLVTAYDVQQPTIQPFPPPLSEPPVPPTTTGPSFPPISLPSGQSVSAAQEPLVQPGGTSAIFPPTVPGVPSPGLPQAGRFPALPENNLELQQSPVEIQSTQQGRFGSPFSIWQGVGAIAQSVPGNPSAPIESHVLGQRLGAAQLGLRDVEAGATTELAAQQASSVGRSGALGQTLASNPNRQTTVNALQKRSRVLANRKI